MCRPNRRSSTDRKRHLHSAGFAKGAWGLAGRAAPAFGLSWLLEVERDLNDQVRQALQAEGDDGGAARKVDFFVYPDDSGAQSPDDTRFSLEGLDMLVRPASTLDGLIGRQIRELASAEFDELTLYQRSDLPRLGWVTMGRNAPSYAEDQGHPPLSASPSCRMGASAPCPPGGPDESPSNRDAENWRSGCAGSAMNHSSMGDSSTRHAAM